MNRLLLALAAYVGIGLLVWTTLSDEKIRLVTLAILTMFAVKTLLHRKNVIHRDDGDEGNGSPM